MGDSHLGLVRKPIMAFETDNWPYLEAKFHGPKRDGSVRLIVIHTPEWPESDSGAEAVARYFHLMPDNRKVSCHITVDNNSIVQCVKDSYVAWAAPGANHDGIQIEMTGYANQTPAQWLDKFSIMALALTADAAAQYCLKYMLPPSHLTNEQLRAGLRGIVGHDQVTAVYHESDHRDPGPNFPWMRFMGNVRGAYEHRKNGS
jgi:N-acetyl-anhydromuramyl-L-alanine amidase AmpD